jgi:lysophospholipase L1-like esterase
MFRRAWLAMMLAAVAVIAAIAPGAAVSKMQLPQRIAAVGDSITTATDVGWCCVDPSGANPQYSWSTGDDPAVYSHYQRLIAEKGRPPSGVLNAAAPGADSSDLGGQLAQAAAFGADYVTILMGGNDICWNPTPIDTFRQRVETAFASYFTSAPNARVFVSSIPNIYQLWNVLHTNPLAQLTWNAFNICPEMLNAATTDDQRRQLLDLEKNFNDILASTCARYANCRWDGYATFNYAFTASDISTVDYFHPSIRGQNTLATITWNASFWSN